MNYLPSCQLHSILRLLLGLYQVSPILCRWVIFGPIFLVCCPHDLNYAVAQEKPVPCTGILNRLSDDRDGTRAESTAAPFRVYQVHRVPFTWQRVGSTFAGKVTAYWTQLFKAGVGFYVGYAKFVLTANVQAVPER